MAQINLKKINRRKFLYGGGVILLSFFPLFKRLKASSKNIFKISCGSCLSQEKDQPIWKSILEEKSDVFIFMGDNVYGDNKNNSDLNLLKRAYKKQKIKIPFKRLKETNEIFSIWDDHDYGKNDGGKEFENKKEAKELFLKFWDIPSDDKRRNREGLYFSKKRNTEIGIIQFIFLDTRYFRSALKLTDKQWAPKKEKYIADYDSKKTYLGDKQWNWLKKAFKEKSDIKILISSIQVLAEGHGFEKWGNFPLEKRRLYNLIDENDINKLIILSGDRHRAGIYKDRTKNGNELYELTSSSLNLAAGKLFKAVEEAGPNRIGPTYLMENYGTLEINNDKNIKLSIKDLNQQTQNEIKIDLS